ncbi:MAG: hypothetical protein ACNA7V_06940 [Bacteroidales bacterium]
MKKASFLFSLIIAVQVGFAQIVVNQSDMPSAGDTIRVSNSFETGGINFETTGANQYWDFSALYAVSQQVEEFFTVQQTPWLYQLVFLTSANLAKSFEEFDQLPGLELSDPYEFYRNNNTDFRYVGFGVTLNGIPIPNKYNDPDIIYKFPVTYGNQDSSMATFSLSLPGFGYYGGWKKRVNHVDGWGILKTPFGEFDVLKVKSDIAQYDSIFLDTLGTGIPLYREYIEYKWIGKDFGLPLCTVTDDEFFTSVVYIDSVRNLFTGFAGEIAITNDFSIFPNPADEHITIEFPDNQGGVFDLLFFDVAGSLRSRLVGIAPENDDRWIRLHLKEIGLESGLWLVVVMYEGESVVKKLMVY